MSDPLPESLAAALTALLAALRAGAIPAVVVGGIAVSLLGRPRLTRDIDALVNVPEDAWDQILATGSAFGIVPRHADPLVLARTARVLLLRHEPSGVDIDLILGSLPFEVDAVTSARPLVVAGLEVPLPRVEDLMIMKAVAQRPRDLADLEGLLQLHPDADLQRVRSWVREFAHAATMPTLLAEFDRLLAALRRDGRS